MTALSVSAPFPTFTDVDGDPLENGYVYIGQPNLDPVAFPVQAYWDATLTTPAAQPIRTSGGYPVRNGIPARVYVDGDYSIRVNNKNGSLVYSSLAATERIGTDLISAIDSSVVSYMPSGTGAVVTTVNEELNRQFVNVKRFGAVGDGVTDDSAAINKALAGGNKVVYFPPGTYYIEAEDVVVGSNTIIEGGFAAIKYGKASARSVITRMYVSNASNVVIRNLRIDGNMSVWPNANVYTFQIYDSTDVTIAGCEIYSGIGAGISVSQSNNQGATNKRILIDNNHIHDIGSASIVAFYAYGNGVAVTGGQDVVVRNNNIHDIYAVGAINLEGLLQNNIQVVGNRIWNTTGNASGIKIYAGGVDVASNYITIRDNILSNLSTDSAVSAEPAIWIEQGGKSVSVVGNKISYANADGIVVNNGEFVLIDGNSINNSPNASIFVNTAFDFKVVNNSLIYESGATVAQAVYCETPTGGTGPARISGNTVKNAPYNAFILNARTPLIFTENTIIDARSAGTKGYGVASSAGLYQNCIMGANIIIDTIGSYSTRFWGFYNFSGNLTNNMSYIPDGWTSVSDGMPRFDFGANGTAIVTNDALASAAPTSGYHRRGTVVWNASAAASGVPGWVCVTSGTPGTWKAMANLAA